MHLPAQSANPDTAWLWLPLLGRTATEQVPKESVGLHERNGLGGGQDRQRGAGAKAVLFLVSAALLFPEDRREGGRRLDALQNMKANC